IWIVEQVLPFAVSHREYGWEELVKLVDRTLDGDARIEVGAEGDEDILRLLVDAPRHGSTDRNPQIGGEIQRPDWAIDTLIVVANRIHVRIVEAVEIYRWSRGAIVPPERDAVSLHKLKKALEDRFFDGVASRVPIRVGICVDLARRMGVS